MRNKLKHSLVILSGAVLIVTLLACYSIKPQLDVFYPAISDWGSHPNTANIFNTGLLASGILLAASLVLSKKLISATFTLIGISLLVGFPLPTYNQFDFVRAMHWLGAGILFIVVLLLQYKYLTRLIHPWLFITLISLYYILAIWGGLRINQLALWCEIALLFGTIAVYLAWSINKLRQFLWSKM